MLKEQISYLPYGSNLLNLLFISFKESFGKCSYSASLKILKGEHIVKITVVLEFLVITLS
jgi:hypothetical protein